MAKWITTVSAALVLGLAAIPAQAQVTAEEVFESWQSLSSGMGQTVTHAPPRREGNALVVEDIVLAFDDSQDVRFDSALGTMRFTETGTGEVEITMSDSYAMTYTVKPEGVGPETVTRLEVAQPGLKLVTKGKGDTQDFAFDVPTLTIRIAEVRTADVVQNVTGMIAFTGVSGNYLLSRAGEGDALTQTMDYTFKAASGSVSGYGDIDGTAVTVNVALTDLGGAMDGTFLAPAMMADMTKAMAAGFAFDMDMRLAAMTYDVDVTEDGQTTGLKGSVKDGVSVASMGEAALDYTLTTGAADITVSGPEIPFPELRFAYADAAFGMTIPAGKSDAPQPFRYLTRLTDLTISDEVWALFDPSGAFPRDPVSVVVDTVGEARVMGNLFDPAAMDADTPPMELTALTLTELRAKAFGAEAKATGSLTFDNSDTTTFDGVPVPTGELLFNLSGANALIDKLVAMGFVPEDQAMGARMMMAMFFRPGDAQDTLTSIIAFKDKGIYANGQKLR